MEYQPLFLALPWKKDPSRSLFSRCAYHLSTGPNRKTSAIDETSTQAHLSQLRSHRDLLTKSSKCQSSPLTHVRDRGGVRLWRSRIITRRRDETFIPWKPVKVSGYAAQFCQWFYLINGKKQATLKVQCLIFGLIDSFYKCKTLIRCNILWVCTHIPKKSFGFSPNGMILIYIKEFT